MITSFEVGAVFKIINKASPTITAILRQVRALNDAVEKARLALADLTKAGTNLPANTGITAAIAETNDLAKAWGNVARSAGQARAAIGSASMAATRSSGAAIAAAGGGGGGLRLGHRRGSFPGAHFYGPGTHIPGGSHVSLSGPAMAGAALLGWGVIEAGQMQDAYASFLYHTGEADTPANAAFFRNTIQKAMLEGGVTSLHDVTESATDVVRQMKGTKTGGVDIMSEVIRAARTENLMKGGGNLKDATDAMLGLAHMTKTYDPETIKKLFAPFAFMSVANPDSLTRMQTAASYAVPILQSGLGIDPLDSLLLGTALRRAGASSSKSGTWLARAMEGSLPGTSTISKFRFGKHEKALRALGLVDENGKPTWYGANGKLDPFKMLEIANQHLDRLPVSERMGILHQAFGEQGARGVALLSDPAVRDQFMRLKAERDSSAFRNRYANFMGTYYDRSPVQQARVALADFNVTMMDLGVHVLPAVSGALKDFKSVLDTLRGVIPGADKGGAGLFGKRALEGAVAGATIGAGIGAFGGPVGALGGAAIGAGVGGVYGIAEQYMQTLQRPMDRFGRNVVVTGNSAAQAADHMKALGDAIKGLSGAKTGGVFPGGTSAASPMHHISLSLNVDGQTLAQAVSQNLAHGLVYSTGAPAGNDSAAWTGGDDYSDDI